MPFNLPENNTRTFDRPVFLRLDPGSHLIRFLDAPEDTLMVYTHFIMGKFTITCPGEGCPVCSSNKKLIAEFPDNFRDQKGYSPRVTAFLSNVLDRTLAKVCPSCQAEIKPGGLKNTFPSTCPECNGFLHEVKPLPLNKVKILKFGIQLATQLNTVERATCNADGEPLGLTNFDIALSIEGSRQKKVTTPIPVSNNTDVVSVPEEALQNKETAMINLSPSEILDLLKGVSLKDIFTARRTATAIAGLTQKEDTAPWDDEMSSEEVRQDIANLLK